MYFLQVSKSMFFKIKPFSILAFDSVNDCYTNNLTLNTNDILCLKVFLIQKLFLLINDNQVVISQNFTNY